MELGQAGVHLALGEDSSSSDDDELVLGIIAIAHGMAQEAAGAQNSHFNQYWEPLLQVAPAVPLQRKAFGRAPNSWLARFARAALRKFRVDMQDDSSNHSSDSDSDASVPLEPDLHFSCERQSKQNTGLSCGQLLLLAVYLEEVIFAFWSALRRRVPLEIAVGEPDGDNNANPAPDQDGEANAAAGQPQQQPADNGAAAAGDEDDHNEPRLLHFDSWSECVAFAQQKADQDIVDPTSRDIDRLLETHHGVSVSIFEWVFVTVHYLAKSPFIRTLPPMTGVSKSTISLWVRAVLCALSTTLFKKQVYMPASGSPEWEASRRLMFLKSHGKLADCVGAIDDTHVHVCVSEERGRDMHINYKGDATIALQAIVSADLLFWYVDAGKPGRGNDRSRLISGTLAREQCQGSDSPGPVKYPAYVLGDSGYWPGQWWLPTPYCARPCPARRHSTQELLLYNACVAKARVVVEQAFGVLFACFRSMKATWTGNLNANQVLLRLQACLALHNFRMRSNMKPPSVRRGLASMLDGKPLHRRMAALSAHSAAYVSLRESQDEEGALTTVLGYEYPLLGEGGWISDNKRQIASRGGASRRAYLVDSVLSAADVASQEAALYEAAVDAPFQLQEHAPHFALEIDGQNILEWVRQHVLHAAGNIPGQPVGAGAAAAAGDLPEQDDIHLAPGAESESDSDDAEFQLLVGLGAGLPPPGLADESGSESD